MFMRLRECSKNFHLSALASSATECFIDTKVAASFSSVYTLAKSNRRRATLERGLTVADENLQSSSRLASVCASH